MTARLRPILLAAVLAAAAPFAQARVLHDPGPVTMSIVDREAGSELAQYAHAGQRWVPGTPGHRYAVRLANHSPRRVLVVLSVDGVNAVSGQTAAGDQGGYVLEPWQTTEVAGWRKSMRDVAQFYFADFGDSYTARTGRPLDVGVVGIAVFDEARRVQPPQVALPPHARASAPVQADAAAPAAAEMAQSHAQELGTGHGRREYAPVSRTDFVRASRNPVQVVELRYDDERALVARGIVPWRGRAVHRAAPRAFPGGFVPDPPRHR